MNAKPNISDFQHRENVKRAEELRAKGFSIEATAQGYRVWHGKKYLGGAGTVKPPHGRYAEANIRDNLASALSLCK